MEGVHGIFFDEVGKLGVGSKNELYWDGKEIMFRNEFVLGTWELRWAGLASLSTFFMAVMSLLELKRKLKVDKEKA